MTRHLLEPVRPFPTETSGLWNGVFETQDVARARDHVAGLLSDHRLDHYSVEAAPLFRHRHARLGDLGIHDLEYTMFGGEALIRAPKLPGIYLLELNRAGTSHLLRDGVDTPFRAGELCVSNAGEDHVKRWSTDGRQTIVRILAPKVRHVLAGMLGVSPLEPVRFDSLPMGVDGWTGALVRLVDLIHQEMDTPDSRFSGRRAARSAERMLIELLLETIPNNYTARIDGALPEPAPAPLKRAVDYVQANATDAIGPADIAAAAGVSGRTLSRAFRRAYGVSPGQFLRDHRLDRAYDRLRARGAPGVTEIAFDLGFTHLGRFAADYRARFGETPSQTRSRGK
jgi:AraC-like DNA-binding protein